MQSIQAWWAAVRKAITPRKSEPDPATSSSLRGVMHRYASGDRDFAGIRLKNRADLVGIDLQEADLTGSDLSGSCLAKANLDGACLRFADLRNAQLYETSLRGADLRRTHLAGANLLLADLQGADLTGAQVSEAALAAAFSLEGAVMPDGLPHSPDTQARLQQASLRQAQDSLDTHLRGRGL